MPSLNEFAVGTVTRELQVMATVRWNHCLAQASQESNPLVSESRCVISGAIPGDVAACASDASTGLLEVS